LLCHIPALIVAYLETVKGADHADVFKPAFMI